MRKILAFMLVIAMCAALTTVVAAADSGASTDKAATSGFMETVEGILEKVEGFVDGILDKLEELIPGLPRWALLAMLIAGPVLLIVVIIIIIAVSAKNKKRRRAAAARTDDTRTFTPQRENGTPAPDIPDFPEAPEAPRELYCECGAALKPTMKFCPLCGKPTGVTR